jgi:hypothetical protein
MICLGYNVMSLIDSLILRAIAVKISCLFFGVVRIAHSAASNGKFVAEKRTEDDWKELQRPNSDTVWECAYRD